MENSPGGPPTEPWRDLVENGGIQHRPVSVGLRRSVPPINPSPASVRRDVRAEKEEAAFADGELEHRAKVNDYNRAQSVKTFVHTIALIAIGVMGVGFLAFGFVWTLHYLMPIRWRWLAPEEMAVLDRIIMHGLSFITGGVLTKYVMRHVT